MILSQSQAEFLGSSISNSDGSARLRFALGARFETFRDVWKASERDVISIRNVGPTTIRELRRMFSDRGFRFATSNSKAWDPVDGDPVEESPVAPPQSEFLPVSASDFARVSEVDVVNVHGARVELYTRSGATCYASAPYFAAWLDRLGIPWTDDLRKAHEAGTKKGGEA